MATTRFAREFLDFGDCSLDPSDGCLTRNDRPVHLTPITIRILLKLLESPGDLVSKEDLKQTGWSLKSVEDGTFHRKITELRKALGDGEDGNSYIENVPARGYRFVAPVTRRLVAADLPPTEDQNAGAASASGSNGHKDAAPGRTLRLNRGKVGLLAAAAFLAVFAAAYAGFSLRENVSEPQIEAYRKLTHNGLQKCGPLLRDGSRLYFAQGSENDCRPAYTSIDGNDVVPLNPPVPGEFLGIAGLNASTGELLLLEHDALSLWMPGRSWARRLGFKGVDHAGFSADGRILAVSRDTNVIEIYNASDLTKRGPTVSLPQHSQQRFSIAWSPSGDTIRFSVYDLIHGKSAIWEAGVNGRSAYPVYSAGVSGCCGAWTPDGRWFVFSTLTGEEAHNRGDLWVAPEPRIWAPWLRRSEPTPLKSAISFSWPAIGADGKTIFAIGSTRGVKAVRLDLRTKGFSPFLNQAPALDFRSSGDGNWIAYTDDWEHTIWKSKPDGSERTKLTFLPMDAYQPHWSPDGNRIAFMGRLPGHHWRAYVISSSGGEPEAVNQDNNEQGVPTWSPDGRYLIFGDRHDQRPGSQMTIHVWDFRSRRLSDLPGSSGRWSPRWSPDGRYIAAQSADWHHLDLFDTRRQTWERLETYNNTDDLNWSPDGAYLYFLAIPPSGETRICYRVRISDRKIEEILRLGEHPELDGHLAGIASDGSPVFCLIVSNEEIYALDMKWP